MRIALATAGTTGDIRPFVTVARRLSDAGHEVTAVTWPLHAPLFSAARIRVVNAGPHDDATRQREVAEAAATLSPIAQVEVLRDYHLMGAEEQYRQLRDALTGYDLVVLHSIHSLAHAAVLDLAVPWATAVFDPVLLPTATAPPAGMPNLGPANRLAWWVLDRALARTAKPLNAVLASAGSRQRDLPLFRARSELLHMVACSPSLVTLPADAPARTRLTGAWLDERAPADLPADLAAFLDGGQPPAVITFGSMGGPGRELLDAAIGRLLAAGMRVVVQGLPPAQAREDDRFDAGGVDHRALFPRAAVVVHHGGAGTTHAACRAGAPSVVVPHVGDQRWWGERLHRLGVASKPISLRSLQPAQLADAILEAASHTTLQERARALGTAMSAEDGAGAAVQAIEDAVSA